MPELGTLRARVVDALDDHIVLAPLQRPATPLLLLRYDATLRRAGASSDEEGLVGTMTRRGERWVFDPSSHQRHQRRGAVRVDVAAPVRVTTTSGTVLDAETVDLSATGGLIRLPAAPAVGGTVELELALPDGRPPLRSGGLVVRGPAPDLAGVRFERLDDAGQRRLARFLFTQQWAASRPSHGADAPPRPRSRVAS